jgi:hypothetical protein
MIDRTTLKIALETDAWMAVYCVEPERLIDVQMRYKDLVAIRKLIVRYCEEQSKVDLIHPIRCNDCKYAKPIDSEWLECQHDKRVMKATGFCSWAEPKGEKDDR